MLTKVEKIIAFSLLSFIACLDIVLLVLNIVGVI